MRRIYMVAFVLATMTGTVFAEDAAPYLTSKNLDLTILLPPPPHAGSIMEKSELAAVVATQNAAGSERIKLASDDVNETIFQMFGKTLGPSFALKSLPKTSALFDRVGSTESAVADPAKKYFARVRPFMTSSDVKALIKPSRSGSWPSGHTTRVTASAIILAAMLPERREAIWARADEYAESRVVGGMHYPSDLEAARLAGTAIAAELFSDPAFQVDFKAAKSELRSLEGL